MKPHASWKSIGSAPFVITLLTILGLGGGFLLAFLPFNSAERSVTSRPRNFPEFRSFPIPNSSPSAEPTRDPEKATKERELNSPLAPINARAAHVFARSEIKTETPFPTIATCPALANLLHAGAAVSMPGLDSAPATSERWLSEAPVAALRTSAGFEGKAASFEGMQTAVVPEPTTWTLFALAIVVVVFASRRWRRSA